ncbi:predicted protein [Naegleria gruberi]|uniref:Predicted protein n=1 Tax=Naegleria gruberi TaxID=5762 RepID=D2VF57_NAEGR|nr:uncharacterized protein NAEGRDRAFT_49036 [Naegleria gruberi]EFC44626.1 predicted protein [Naegleria gruberi]|eukprot:XP_002677370.1 predicted protein [Naegleria gruberi strain NEG-M]
MSQEDQEVIVIVEDQEQQKDSLPFDQARIEQTKLFGTNQTNSLFPTNDQPKTRFVLSIDGGGVRGTLAGSILATLEKEVIQEIAKHFAELGEKPPTNNFSLTSCFDLVVGTSTGGIIALGAGISNNGGPFDFKFSASDLGDLYTNNSSQIFSKEFKHGKLREFLISSRYDPTGLEIVMEKYFGKAKLSDLVIPVMVTSYDLNRQELVVFDSEMAKPKGELTMRQLPSDYYLKDIALATSAAPTFFPIRTIESITDPSDKHDYIDAAVTANNPTMLAYLKAKKMYPGDSINIVSLGCGYEGIDRPSLEGKIEWAKTISSLMIQGASNLTEYLMQQMVDLSPLDKYWRIDVKLDQAALDLTSEDYLKSLKILGSSLRTNDGNAYKNIRDTIIDFYRSKSFYTCFKLIEKVESQLMSPKYRKNDQVRIDLSDVGLTPIALWEVVHYLKNQVDYEKIYKIDLSGQTITVEILEQLLHLRTEEAPEKLKKKHCSVEKLTVKTQILEEKCLIHKLIMRDCQLSGQVLAWLVNKSKLFDVLDLGGSVKLSECDSGFLDSLCQLSERGNVILEGKAYWVIGNHYRYFEKFDHCRKSYKKGSELGDVDCEYLDCLMGYFTDNLQDRNEQLHQILKNRNERVGYLLGLAIEQRNLSNNEQAQQSRSSIDSPSSSSPSSSSPMKIPQENDPLPPEFVEYEIENHHALCVDWYVRVSQSISTKDSSQPWIDKAKLRLSKGKTLLPAASSLGLVLYPQGANTTIGEAILSKKERKDQQKKEKQEEKEREKERKRLEKMEKKELKQKMKNQ